jgi:hypothetical protein
MQLPSPIHGDNIQLKKTLTAKDSQWTSEKLHLETKVQSL